MNIPSEALNIAATVLIGDYYVNDTGNLDPLQWRSVAQSALTAAMPAIEVALRKQIATEIRLGINEYSGQLIEQAARIAEKGNTK